VRGNLGANSATPRLSFSNLLQIVPAMTHGMLLPELSDIAISHLFTDQTSSRACALVCRSWLHPARRNLFHCIWLTFAEKDVTRFLGLLRVSPGIGAYIREVHWNLPTWPSTCPADSELTVSLLRRLEALSHEHGTTHKFTIDMSNSQAHYLLHALGHAPSLVSYIKSICWGCGDGAVEWGASEAQSLASMLDSVESLTLSQWSIFRYYSVVPFEVLGGLFSTSITELVLDRLVFTDGSQFRHFVHAFTALERLSYQIMHWEDSTANTTKRGLPHAPPLRCITLGAAPQAVSAEVIRWLLDQPVAPPLKSIEASSFPPNEINELIHCCASSLVTLACNGK
jgi:hypothetical protein